MKKSLNHFLLENEIGFDSNVAFYRFKNPEGQNFGHVYDSLSINDDLLKIHCLSNSFLHNNLTLQQNINFMNSVFMRQLDDLISDKNFQNFYNSYLNLPRPQIPWKIWIQISFLIYFNLPGNRLFIEQNLLYILNDADCPLLNRISKNLLQEKQVFLTATNNYVNPLRNFFDYFVAYDNEGFSIFSDSQKAETHIKQQLLKLAL